MTCWSCRYKGTHTCDGCGKNNLYCYGSTDGIVGTPDCDWCYNRPKTNDCSKCNPRTLVCRTCNIFLPSRTRLFKHLAQENHAMQHECLC